MNHYVYKLIDKNTKEFYIGSRSCKCSIENDKYMGSPSVWKPNKHNLIKKIIRTGFKTREDAIKYEAELIKENINKSLNRNYAIPGEHFHTVGIYTNFYPGHPGYWLNKIGPMIGKKHTEQSKQKNREKHLGKVCSKETKRKMSESHTGKIKSKEHRKNLSKSLTGKIVSKEHAQHISEALKIPILQYDMNMNFIKEWAGQIDIKRKLGINHIGDCCKGKIKSVGGFIWKFKGLQ